MAQAEGLVFQQSHGNCLALAVNVVEEAWKSIAARRRRPCLQPAKRLLLLAGSIDPMQHI